MKSNLHRLGELCNMVKGLSAALKTPSGPYPLVVTAHFRRSSDTWQLEGPAVCIPLISSTGHGHAALHRIHYQEGKFALANLLVALLPKDPAVCDSKYLYHLLMARKDELLVPLMQGTANVSLKEQDIATVEIKLPPLAQQRRLVARVHELTNQIHEACCTRQEQDTQVQHLLLSAFQQIANPAPRRKMAEVAPLVRRPVHVDSDSTYPELGLRSFGNGTFHKPSLSGVELGAKRIFQIQPGDLLFSNVFAWEGAIAVARREDAGRVGSHRYITCVPKQGTATSRFLCFYFLTREGLEQVRAASPGGAGRNRTLGLEALARIEVPTPPFSLQRWFDSLLLKVDEITRLHAKIATELDALLPAVLHRAFKGEL